MKTDNSMKSGEMVEMAGKKILVVEDNNIVAMEIRDTLEDLGYAVCGSVSTGKRAIEMTMESKPDLVLMDIQLKGDIDGVNAAEHIRTYGDVPVVFLTAYTDESTVQRAKKTEPFGYIIKPFEEKELHTTIEMALYKHKMEQKLKESEHWLATTLKSIGDAVISTDARGIITFMNPVAETLTGWPQEQGLGKPLSSIFNTRDETTGQRIDNTVENILRQIRQGRYSDHTILKAKDETHRHIANTISPIKDEKERVTGFVLIFQDITEQKRAEQDREQLVTELQEALTKVKTLRGLIPICSSCKRIRDDKGYWNQVETYIKEHSDADFSHGFCPDCMKQLYPDLVPELTE